MLQRLGQAGAGAVGRRPLYVADRVSGRLKSSCASFAVADKGVLVYGYRRSSACGLVSVAKDDDLRGSSHVVVERLRDTYTGAASIKDKKTSQHRHQQMSFFSSNAAMRDESDLFHGGGSDGRDRYSDDGGLSSNSSDSTLSSTANAAAADLDNFDLSKHLADRLRLEGVDTLFPVQAMTYQLVMNGKDMMCKSKTGSGKTLGFALPIIETLDRKEGRGGRRKPAVDGRPPKAIVLAPTRELARQVEREFVRIAPTLQTLSVYGGTPLGPQLSTLRRGVDVIVGTPGRVIDLVKQNALDLSAITFAVLDEADMMLKLGFQEDVETIFSYMPPREQRQNMLWSATMPSWVFKLAKVYLNQPEVVDLVGEDDSKIPNSIQHWTVAVTPGTRDEVLASICTIYGKGKRVIIFTSTKAEVDELTHMPALGRLKAEALHGGLPQTSRERTLARFRDGHTTILVATDVAARGLDIPNVEMVVHYRIPTDQESFVHRSGRTGRAGKNGTNVVLLCGKDDYDYALLEREYQFEGYRIVPPGRDAAVELSGKSAIDNILAVTEREGRPYTSKVEQLLKALRGGGGREEVPEEEEGGLQSAEGKLHKIPKLPAYPREVMRALCGAMAVMAPSANTAWAADSYSMIDGRKGLLSVLFSGKRIKSQRDVQDILTLVDPPLTRVLGSMRRAPGGVLADLPATSARALVLACDNYQASLKDSEEDEDGDDEEEGGSAHGKQTLEHSASRASIAKVMKQNIFSDLMVTIPKKVKGPLEHFRQDRSAPAAAGTRFGGYNDKGGRFRRNGGGNNRVRGGSKRSNDGGGYNGGGGREADRFGGWNKNGAFDSRQERRGGSSGSRKRNGRDWY